MKQKHIQHLYNRAGFAVSYKKVINLKDKPKIKVVNSLFAEVLKTQPLELDLTAFKAFSESLGPYSKINRINRQKLNKKNREKIKDLNYAWIERLVNPDAVLIEKMTLFWANVFVCKDNNVASIQHYNNTLRKFALGDFKQFVKAIAKEASMSKYLNNKQNVKKRPNENFARELMELFTLGIGHYTEQDVKESARAFTGWKNNRKGAFISNPKKHDDGLKTFLGKTGNFDGDAIIDIILEQKQCAKFICEKLYRYFVNPNINEANLKEITTVFYKDYDIQKVMYHIFKSKWFYDDQNIGIKIKSPLELLVGIQTIIPIQFQKPQQLLYLQKMMGQILLNPPNVAGWKGGKSWIDSNTLMFRLKLPSILLNNAIINLESKGEFEDNFENYYKTKKRNYLKTLPSWNDFEKEYAAVSIEELKKILLISNIDKDTEAFLDNLKFNSNKDLCIQLMSIPEYQLC